MGLGLGNILWWGDGAEAVPEFQKVVIVVQDIEVTGAAMQDFARDVVAIQATQSLTITVVQTLSTNVTVIQTVKPYFGPGIS